MRHVLRSSFIIGFFIFASFTLSSNSFAATCQVNGDGSSDTCPSGQVCQNANTCASNGSCPAGQTGGKCVTCGGGTCKPKSQVTPTPTPKAGDSCTHAITDPVGTCGSGMTCVSTGNCTGTGLAQTCDGKCKAAGGNGEDCTSSPGTTGDQGTCKSGFVCDGSGGCTSSFCSGKCVAKPTTNNDPTDPPPPPPPCLQFGANGTCLAFATSVGEINTDASGFVSRIFAILLALSGGIALFLIIRAGYTLMTSQGKPDQINQGREQIIAAIVGLLFLIFSFVILEIIGVDILKVPLSKAPSGTAPQTGGTNPGHGGTCYVQGAACAVPGEVCVPSSAGGNLGHCQPPGAVSGGSCTVGHSGDCISGETCVPDFTGGTTGVCKPTTPGGASCDLAGNGPQCPPPLTCQPNGTGGRSGICK